MNYVDTSRERAIMLITLPNAIQNLSKWENKKNKKKHLSEV